MPANPRDVQEAREWLQKHYPVVAEFVSDVQALAAEYARVRAEQDRQWEAVLKHGASSCGPEAPEPHFHFGSRCIRAFAQPAPQQEEEP